METGTAVLIVGAVVVVALLVGGGVRGLALIFSPKAWERREPCPKCAEPILTKATVCPHCRSELEADWHLAPELRTP